MRQESSSTVSEVMDEPLYDNDTQAKEVLIDKVKRVTNPRMTKFEKAHILGVRALQLSMSAPPLVDIENEIDPLKIALKELNEGKIPFIVRRRLPDGSYEEWNVNELIIPFE